jgi:probable rRNA maturation factor
MDTGLNSRPYTIEFADEQQLPVDQDTLQKIAEAILSDHGCVKAELSIALVDDPTIRKLNAQYLDHDWETDVISFVLDESPVDPDDRDAGFSMSGQLIVSTDTASRVANEIGSTLANELALYVAHGTLHLVGYDDQDEDSITEMKSAEREYLERFSIPCLNREG